jgi:hypothetical protein
MKTICARAQLRRDGRRLESRHEIKQTIGMTTQVFDTLYREAGRALRGTRKAS